MKWIDTLEIAMALVDAYPEYDPVSVNFVDLRNWVMQLPDFDDAPDRCNEKILEAIQQAWLDER
ncbi:MAG: Fe-S cluster assembly protein IscX [Betaproteobacteria bacterium]|nr:Fe-S cluster assembly protein IscX [Betaproteobacteria bacterium]